MSKTCTGCRARKMRCDGASPVCGPCSRARKPIECNYVESTAAPQSQKSPLLQKGAACLPCRRKKKRCDAKRPSCQTCKVAGKSHECQYDEDVRQDVATVLMLRNQELERRLALHEVQRQEVRSVHYGRALAPPQPASEWGTPWSDISRASSSAPVADILQAKSISHDNAGSLPTNPFSYNAELHINGIGSSSALPFLPGSPSPFCTDLAVSAPQTQFQVYVDWFRYNSCVEFYLREEKWDAIRKRDLSGTIVHPAFVHLSYLIGSISWHMHNTNMPRMIDDELEIYRIYRSLDHLPDPVSQAQIFLLVAWYFFFRAQTNEGRVWLKKAYDVVVQCRLELAPADMDSLLFTSSPDEDTKETVTMISQMVFLDKSADLVVNCGHILPQNLDSQIKELPMMHPWLCKNSITIMRTRSLYFLVTAMRLSHARRDVFPRNAVIDYGVLSQDWYDEYWETLDNAGQHASMLQIKMLKSSLSPDQLKTPAIKVCLIVALTAMLELHRLPSNYHVESRQRVVDLVSEIVGITRGIKEEDIPLLNPTLGTCWTIVAHALQQEQQAFLDIANISPEGRMGQAFGVMLNWASKLGTRIPYMEHALQALHDSAARSVPISV